MNASALRDLGIESQTTGEFRPIFLDCANIRTSRLDREERQIQEEQICKRLRKGRECNSKGKRLN